MNQGNVPEVRVPRQHPRQDVRGAVALLGGCASLPGLMTRRRRTRPEGQSPRLWTGRSSAWRPCRFESQCAADLHCGVRL